MTAPTMDTVRANRYDGPCDICGHVVPANRGTLHRVDGRWTARHRPAVWSGSPVSGSYVGGCPDGPPPSPEPRPEPRTGPSYRPAPTVPAGHYAVTMTDGAALTFYRVDVPTDGRWAGYVFVKRVIGGRPDVAVRGADARAVLTAIAADDDAAARYGREIGRCYVCNRHLTDETSRALGIGPDCRTRAA